MDCCIAGCENKAALLPTGKPRHGGKCHAHADRAKRGKSMAEPIRPYGVHPLKRLEEKALELAEADSANDDAYRKVREVIRKIASRYKARRRRKSDNPQNPPKTQG